MLGDGGWRAWGWERAIESIASVAAMLRTTPQCLDAPKYGAGFFFKMEIAFRRGGGSTLGEIEEITYQIFWTPFWGGPWGTGDPRLWKNGSQPNPPKKPGTRRSKHIQGGRGAGTFATGRRFARWRSTPLPVASWRAPDPRGRALRGGLERWKGRWEDSTSLSPPPPTGELAPAKMTCAGHGPPEGLTSPGGCRRCVSWVE